ncbi:bifunctional oligoribonuclease/PAP phosphatase NrnA [Candidatus Berkelbacteria bacterium]|nr:bifunctional oligoribonuclease/PAP phosphatase NrnA [Candidatus Berkelbacteria bacterium]
MELTPKQQAIELIRKAQKIVVMGHASPDGDAVGSVLALTLALRKLGKKVTSVCADPVPPVFNFLPNTDEVTATLETSSEFVISIDTSNVEVDKLGYKNHPDQNKLNIVIKTLSGQFQPDNVSFNTGQAKADLIIVLDTNDVERLGSIYDSYTQLFYETPIINIDHHPGNDYFGKVNWVDLTATSTAEILVSLLESLGTPPKGSNQSKPVNLLDADIATLLLTGITTDTGSFQNTNTTPKSFTVAAQLVAAGARQQEIVQHIYKTKRLSTLKLWGKVLANINEDRAHRFIYSTVASSDFKQFDAEETETSGVIDELLKTVPDIDFAMLLTEKKNALYGSLRGVNKEFSVAEVANLFGGGGHQMAAAFRIPNGSLADNERQIVDQIKQFQASRQGQPQAPQALPADQVSMQTNQPNRLPTQTPKAQAGGGRFQLPNTLPDPGQPTNQTTPSVPNVDDLGAHQAGLK